MPGGGEAIVGALIASAVAGAVIYLDCYQIVSASVRSVPPYFYRSWRVLAVALGCAVIAALAYLLAAPEDTNAISKLLTLQIETPTFARSTPAPPCWC